MKIFVYGIVQGVGFRPKVYNIANSMNLKGYVRNNGSNVEILINKNHKKFISKLKESLPPLAKIEKIKYEKEKDSDFDDFQIKKSIYGQKQSTIPTDTSICQNCQIDLFDKDNKRYLYSFTNCVDCGSRYSLIKDLPYDRNNTSMDEFPLCASCKVDYFDFKNRRFHAQTISCPKCGPKYTLYDRNKNIISENPIKKFAEFIDEGKIGIIKSWGGMHTCCKLEKTKNLREIYNRPNKPFAIMVKGINTAEKYAYIEKHERVLLESSQRPIVLVQKKSSKLEEVSPGLDNVGIYLPYSSLHHILFSYLNSDCVVMTSANLSGEPIILENNDVFSLDADYYLLNNRKIVQRSDDSVVRLYKDRKFFIRRSRGFIPTKIKVPYTKNILAVGAERNVTSAISKDGNMYISQYIGNTRHYPTLEYLYGASNHLMNLLGINFINMVGADLHPRYATKKTAKAFSEQFDAKLVEIQHHWAHATSLAIDNNYHDPIIALSLDGAGYGDDGKIWGGEILFSDFFSYKHLATLEGIPLIGGDKAVYEPKRLVYALQNLLGIESSLYDEDTQNVFSKLIKNSSISTSLGRVLDTVSAYLGICESRTYDGEPAMKLEKYLNLGKNKYSFDISSEHSNPIEINTHSLFRELFSKTPKSDKDKANLAYSFVYTLVGEMTKQAIHLADEYDVGAIGITGGVSYNRAIVKIVENELKDQDIKFLTHNRVPNGDGGISIGQNAILGFSTI